MAKFNTGQSFADGDQVTGAKLNNIIGLLDIYSGVIADQASIAATVSTADLLLIADTDAGSSGAANKVTVQKLLNDTLTGGTFTNANIAEQLTYGTATGNRTVSTSATITTGTIPNLTSSTANITLGTIQTLTAGTTTGTAGIFTSGTVTTLNSTTGTIGNLSTTLAGDFTISQGTGTLGNSGATAATYGTTSLIPVITVDAKGRTTSATSVTNPVGFRNRIINGDMRIWQRGTSGFTTTNSGTFVADRMYMFSGVSTTSTASQVTSTTLSGFPFATRIQRSSGNTGTNDILYFQAIETSNCQDLAGRTISVSFYARAGSDYSAASSNLLALVATGSGSDQGIDSWIASTWTSSLTSTIGTAVLTTSWQRFSYSYTVPAGTNEIILAFNSPRTGTAGANDYFDITGIQLEAGSNATDFERRPIGTELALCQRYFYRYATANADFQEIANRTGLTTAYISINTPEPMRTTPTAVLGSAPLGRVVGYNSTFGATTGTVSAFVINTDLGSNNSIPCLLTHASITAANGLYGFTFDTAGASSAIGLSAEL